MKERYGNNNCFPSNHIETLLLLFCLQKTTTLLLNLSLITNLHMMVFPFPHFFLIPIILRHPIPQNPYFHLSVITIILSYVFSVLLHYQTSQNTSSSLKEKLHTAFFKIFRPCMGNILPSRMRFLSLPHLKRYCTPSPLHFYS